MRVPLSLFAALFLALPAERKQGNPLDHLPPHFEVLTHFGERADISPDNLHVAFMAKSFGDAMVIDLNTREIRCLTCNVPAAVFLRVMHLVTGDYILIGPDHFENIRVSRTRDNELWFLSKERGSRPIKLGQKMSEGAAISKKSLKISYSETSQQNPDLASESSRLVVAELDLSQGPPALINKKIVYESKDRSCTLEAQDFYDNDDKMTFTCYEPRGQASVMGIDLRTGVVTNFSKAPGSYNEVEGIFPDGLYTAVEADRQCEQLGGTRGSGKYRHLETEARRNRKGLHSPYAFQRLCRRESFKSSDLHRWPLHGVPSCQDGRPRRRRLWHFAPSLQALAGGLR